MCALEVTIGRMEPTTDHQSVELGRLRRLPPEVGGNQPTYLFDLTAHEQHRLATVLAATPDLDPGAVLTAEAEAYRMLYGGLDAEQRATHRMLVDAGVLDA